jgi:hypothetical protein
MPLESLIGIVGDFGEKVEKIVPGDSLVDIAKKFNKLVKALDKMGIVKAE